MKKNTEMTFKENNKCVEFSKEDGKIIVKKSWNDDSFHFEFESKRAMSFLKNMILPKELFAIYHKDKELYEFIYLPLPEKYERSFDYIYQGLTYKLYYGTPSLEFKKLASHFVMNDVAEINERAYGLLRYSRYYKEENERLIPTNFFIQGKFNGIPQNEHITFFKHVNFMLSYYERATPTILIFDTSDSDIGDINIPCLSSTKPFPQLLNTRKLDTTLLELMEAARSSNSYRLKYIFYYQVLEYCSYYYIENDLKRKVQNIVKTPDILNSDAYAQKILELLSDYAQNKSDTQRMDKLITDFCTYDDIKNELLTNGKYFVDDLCFDGGLKICGLFKKIEDIESEPNNIFLSIRKNIDKIRNVLVHARESRENVVISPTHKNVLLLRPYLYLLRRLAEIVITRFE